MASDRHPGKIPLHKIAAQRQHISDVYVSQMQFTANYLSGYSDDAITLFIMALSAFSAREFLDLEEIGEGMDANARGVFLCAMANATLATELEARKAKRANSPPPEIKK